MSNLYGVWLPFNGDQKWLQDVTGHDLVTPDHSHANQTATEECRTRIAITSLYDRGHNFHRAWGMCIACKASPERARNRWCPHSNPPVELEVASVARLLWETDDRVAALTIEAAEGRDPPPELLERLYENDVRGLRSEAEERAKAMR